MSKILELDDLTQFFKQNTFNNPITIRNNERIEKPNQCAQLLIYLLERRRENEGYEPYKRTLIEIYNTVKQQIL